MDLIVSVPDDCLSFYYGLRTFRYEAVLIWNSLPNVIRTAESHPQFKRLMHNWNGSMCRCPTCVRVPSPVLFVF